jgi:hypothetical protein
MDTSLLDFFSPMIKKKSGNQVCSKPVIPATGWLRQEYLKFEVILGFNRETQSQKQSYGCPIM